MPGHHPPGRPDTGDRESGHPDPGHPDPEHPDPGQPDPGQPDPGHPDPGYDESSDGLGDPRTVDPVGRRVGGLFVHTFGPATDRTDPPAPHLLALHGITGHGGRWRRLATGHLPDVRVVAPDLRGHGRSTWTPPWNLEAHADDAAAVVRDLLPGPTLVLAHSFGCAVALALASRAPELVRALVLLEPPPGQSPDTMETVARLTIDHFDYTDRDEARGAKLSEAWGRVPSASLEDELDAHLVPAAHGRVAWRVGLPAVVAGWGELARPASLPGAGTPTVVVRGARVAPPYVRPEFVDALRTRLGADLVVRDLPSDHMVEQECPAEVAELVRSVL